jgi:guanosine-3',5'-bis(diphosphate) 3'-pyrophosphohydrolase
MIIAGLLHDTVEDTDTTFDELEEKFGSRATGFVRELTDDKSLPKAERETFARSSTPRTWTIRGETV